jgi:hypothetical protein
VASIALARADARAWCRPRQETGLIMRIAATAASRPPGVGRVTPPAGAGRRRRGHRERPRTTRPATPSGNPAKRAHNCIRRRIPAGAMACYLPRYRPFADGTLKCAAAAINMPSGRSLARNCRAAATAAAGRRHKIIGAKRLVPRPSGGPGPFPPLPGLCLPPHRLVTCPGRLPAHRRRNSTEISAVHRESRNNYSP